VLQPKSGKDKKDAGDDSGPSADGTSASQNFNPFLAKVVRGKLRIRGRKKCKRRLSQID